MTLAEKLHGRDNNLSLLRIIGAWTIFFSHCFTLATGSVENEPLVGLLGMNVGTFALDFFFLASGLLVTKSLVDKDDLAAFARARALRVYPGLVLIVLATAFVLGPLVTALPVADYLRDPGTRGYAVWNIVLVRGVHFSLPGVFADLRWPNTVNGSLWSMTYEVRAYLLLAGFWLVGSVFGARRRAFLGTVAVALTFVCLLWHVRGFDGPWDPIPRVCFMFCLGAAAYFLRHHIPLGHGLAAGSLALALAGIALGPDWFRWVHPVCIPYLLLYLSFVPGGALRLYNRVGDYSYGTYLYAFPIQQTWMHLFPGSGVTTLMLGSGIVLFAAAALSWHFVEGPAMRYAHPRKASPKT